jgi:mevalonate kinase
MEGVDATKAGNKSKIGVLMNENHQLLSELGVSHPMLEQLVEACRKDSYGAKLTGAGGGGSMIALTDSPSDVSAAIIEAGGEPILVDVGCEGVRIEKVSKVTRRGNASQEPDLEE